MKRTRIRNTDNYQCKTELRLIRYLFLKKMSIHKYVYPCFVCMATQLLYYVSPPGNRNADSPLGSAETGSGAKECGQSGRGEGGAGQSWMGDEDRGGEGGGGAELDGR